MTPDPFDTLPPFTPDPMAAGLNAAFGSGAVPHASVRARLQAKTGAVLDLHLPDSDELGEPPVRVDEATRSLRDPAGRYQVLGEIGRGGVGVVYKGRDVDLGRDVAMKVLHEKYASDPDVLERFVEEAQIGGQLQHPGIVPVYELGLQHGERPYFAMKLVKGETFAALLGRRKTPSDDRRRFLGIFEQVCQTLAYAHARRVVHRDLKPANVMIGAFGEVQVVDWGFAKVLAKGGVADAAQPPRQPSVASVISTVRSDPQTGSHSVIGSMLGTPAYMPPEQALGDVEHMDRRSDVFGLGAILCEILTGAPPYREADGDLIRQAARGELAPAHRRIEQSDADSSLVALCKECLAPARQARPESALEVAERVGAWLSSVEERARTAQIHAAEARVRARSTLLLSAAALVALLLGGGGYAWMQHEATTRRALAVQRVAEAMNEANALLGQARADGPDQLVLWDRAAASATQASRLADNDDVDQELHRRALGLLATVQNEQRTAQAHSAQRQRDETMQRQLVAALAADDAEVAQERISMLREPDRLDQRYATTFAEYLGGVDLDTLSVPAAVEALGRGGIAQQLAAALDHWAMQRQKIAPESGAARVAHLRAIARRLDAEDPWRDQLRGILAVAALDRKALEQLAARADWDALAPTSFVLLGQSLWEAGAQELAVQVYLQGQERHPAHFTLAFHAARLLELMREPRLPEALTYYRVARALDPRLERVRVDMGWLKLRLKDLAGAAAEFDRLIAEDPTCAPAWTGKGAVLDERGKRDEAIASFRHAIVLEPKLATAYFNLGVTLYAQRNLEEAIANYRHTIELDPKCSAAYNNLGNALSDQHKLDDAIASYRQAIAIDHECADAYNNLGNALYKVRRFQESVDNCRQAIAIDPKKADPHNGLGIGLMSLGRIDEGIDSYRNAIAIEPGFANAHNNLGNALLQKEDWEAALASYDRAILIEPEYVNALIGRGNALKGQEKFDEAIASFRRAIQIDPKVAFAHNCLGTALYRKHDLDHAIECYRTAIDLDPGFAAACYNLGLALHDQDKLDDAITWYHRAIGVDPRYVNAYYSLGNALLQQGKPSEAIEYYKQVIAIDPGLARGHYVLGNALSDLERLDAAMLSYHRAIQLDPKYVEAHFNLGVSLEREGKFEQALSSFRNAHALVAGRTDEAGARKAEHAEQAIAQTQALLAVQTELLAIVRGERQASSPEEWAAAADAAYQTGDYAGAARTYGAAFVAHPDLLEKDPHRYNAACTAVLAGCGKRAELLGDKERKELRARALQWLRDDLAAWQKRIAGERELARGALAHWQGDPDLAGVRDTDALKTLSAAEAEAWRALWHDVGLAMTQADGRK